MPYKKIIFLSILLAIALIPVVCLADFSPNGLLKKVAGTGGWQVIEDGTSPGIILAQAVGTIILAFLSLIGIIFMILLIYGGYGWMTARGNEEKVAQARKIITDAILGILVILSAGVITNFIVYRI